MKVFGIGLSKTGTKTLSAALHELGFATIHCPTSLMRVEEGVVTFDPSFAASYDAMVDGPTSSFYELLDQHWPESKFILTTRNVEAWARSAQNHFTKRKAFFRNFIHGKAEKLNLQNTYGSEVFDDSWVEVVTAHETKARAYFSERPNDFLVYSPCEGQGWFELCRFLNKEIPRTPFPHKNRTGSLENLIPIDTLYK